MINQTTTEYDAIKVLREIQLMQNLDGLCDKLYKEGNIQSERPNGGKGLFLPELIDIISVPATVPQSADTNIKNMSPSTQVTDISSDGQHHFKNVQMIDQSNVYDQIDVSQICLVMEYMEADIDTLLKHEM